jgi:cysteine desulfurase
MSEPRENPSAIERVYLDWNATTPPLPEVLAAMMEAGRHAWANPASVHGDGRRARRYVEDARFAVADLVSADARDVVLTSGGTEANNLAIRSAFPRREGTASRALPRVLVSRAEHPSVIRVCEALEREGLARVRIVELREGGEISLASLESALAEEPEANALVCLQAVNHETGAIQPVAEAIALCHVRNVPVHVDAVQAFGRLDPSSADPRGSARS